MLKITTRLILLLGIFAHSLVNEAFAQDPQYSQFYANPIYLNPAFAGTNRCPRLNMNYRNQWPGLTGTFVTTTVAYDQHVDGLSGGLGFMVTNDRAGEGTLNTTEASVIYSYQLNVSRNFSLKAGFQATFLQKRLDWSKLTFGDQIDPRRGFIYETQEQQANDNVNTVDFSAGVLGFSKNFYFGGAVHHITEPNEALIRPNVSRLPRRYTGHIGAVIPIGGKYSESSISPNVLYNRQGDFQQINIGLYAKKGPIIGGLWYRDRDAFIILIGFENDLFKFGYSYDITISQLGMQTFGSHELSLGLRFGCKPKKKTFRTVNCPSF
jgi:type IX secretion system PorP/SprF family membrane protein